MRPAHRIIGIPVIRMAIQGLNYESSSVAAKKGKASLARVVKESSPEMGVEFGKI